MEVRSEWYSKIAGYVNQAKNTPKEKGTKKYKLNLLLGVAERLDEFHATCGQCQLHQQEMTSLASNLGNLIQLDNKERRKAYLQALNGMVKHLQKQHKLVTEGYYTGIGLAIGAGIGAALGPLSDRIGAGLPIGIGIGMAIGAALEAKARKEGRLIYTKEKVRGTKEFSLSPRTIRFFVIIGIATAVAGLLAFFLTQRTTP